MAYVPTSIGGLLKEISTLARKLGRDGYSEKKVRELTQWRRTTETVILHGQFRIREDGEKVAMAIDKEVDRKASHNEQMRQLKAILFRLREAERFVS